MVYGPSDRSPSSGPEITLPVPSLGGRSPWSGIAPSPSGPSSRRPTLVTLPSGLVQVRTGHSPPEIRLGRVETGYSATDQPREVLSRLPLPQRAIRGQSGAGCPTREGRSRVTRLGPRRRPGLGYSALEAIGAPRAGYPPAGTGHRTLHTPPPAATLRLPRRAPARCRTMSHPRGRDGSSGRRRAEKNAPPKTYPQKKAPQSPRPFSQRRKSPGPQSQRPPRARPLRPPCLANRKTPPRPKRDPGTRGSRWSRAGSDAQNGASSRRLYLRRSPREAPPGGRRHPRFSGPGAGARARDPPLPRRSRQRRSPSGPPAPQPSAQAPDGTSWHTRLNSDPQAKENDPDPRRSLGPPPPLPRAGRRRRDTNGT